MLNGPSTEAIANADAHLNNAGLATYTEARDALAELLTHFVSADEARAMRMPELAIKAIQRAEAVLAS